MITPTPQLLNITGYSASEALIKYTNKEKWHQQKYVGVKTRIAQYIYKQQQA